MAEGRSTKKTTPLTEASAVEARIVALAEQLGQIVGTAQGKADGWLASRNLTEQLTRIRDGAADLLSQVGTSASSAAREKPRKPEARASTGRKPQATASKPPAKARAGRSGGMVDAPGKAHRKPPPNQRGVKSSDQMIPKARAAEQMRQRRHP